MIAHHSDGSARGIPRRHGNHQVGIDGKVGNFEVVNRARSKVMSNGVARAWLANEAECCDVDTRTDDFHGRFDRQSQCTLHFVAFGEERSVGGGGAEVNTCVRRERGHNGVKPEPKNRRSVHHSTWRSGGCIDHQVSESGTRGYSDKKGSAPPYGVGLNINGYRLITAVSMRSNRRCSSYQPNVG